MDDLVTWLRAQIDEDERMAREALDVDARTFTPPEFTVEYQWARMTRHTSGGSGHGFAAGAPSPARVLAEVEAKRRIIELHHETDDARPTYGDCVICRQPWWPCMTLALLALPYAGQPGFREEWRV